MTLLGLFSRQKKSAKGARYGQRGLGLGFEPLERRALLSAGPLAGHAEVPTDLGDGSIGGTEVCVECADREWKVIDQVLPVPFAQSTTDTVPTLTPDELPIIEDILGHTTAFEDEGESEGSEDVFWWGAVTDPEMAPTSDPRLQGTQGSCMESFGVWIHCEDPEADLESRPIIEDILGSTEDFESDGASSGLYEVEIWNGDCAEFGDEIAPAFNSRLLLIVAEDVEGEACDDSERTPPFMVQPVDLKTGEKVPDDDGDLEPMGIVFRMIGVDNDASPDGASNRLDPMGIVIRMIGVDNDTSPDGAPSGLYEVEVWNGDC
jgi:hypothetical protein